MYAIKLKEGVYHQAIGWCANNWGELSKATLYKSKEEANDVIKRHKLRFHWIPQIVSVSV